MPNVQTEEAFHMALRVLENSSIVAVDTETFWSTPTLMGCSAHVREPVVASYYFPFRHDHNQTLFRNDPNLPLDLLELLGKTLNSPDKTLLMHNAKFDLKVFETEGIYLTNDFYDTQIMAHMWDENVIKKLKTLCGNLFGDDARDQEQFMKTLRKNLPWEETPPVVMGPYAMKDVELTYKLWEYLMVELRKQQLLDLWPKEAEFLRVLKQIEQNGVKLDQRVAKQLAYTSQARMQELQDELGFDPMKPSQLAHKLYAAPPEGLGFPLPRERSKRASLEFGKLPVMDVHVLRAYDHPDVQKVLEYRGLNKAHSTWFQGFLDVLGSDGRIHPDYRQDGTKTTRRSCAEPNMQQIPRVREEEIEQHVTKKLVKTMFTVDSGYELWSYDYSQLEYRLAGCYSKEDSIIDAYRAGVDFHQLTADKLNIPRFDAKTLNFLILYGGGAGKAAYALGLDEDAARDLIHEFWKSYPRLKKTVDTCTRAAEGRGWVRLWTGRRRHFQYPSEYRKAFNSVIQGGGAEIVKESMLRLYRAGYRRIVGEVHDALWNEFLIGEDHSRFIELMEWPKEVFPIPFPVEGEKMAPK